MSRQHDEKNIPDRIIESKEGQRVSLCCNKGFGRCPSLEYNFIESTEKLNQAFDILFEEMLKDKEI